MRWEEIQELHTKAAADVAQAAERVPAGAWLTPRGEGKWSPAEVLEHLNLAYSVLLRELSGGAGMKVRTKLWQRIYLRLAVIPKILAGKGFPEGAPAPREVRPAAPAVDQSTAIATFREQAARFTSAAVEAHASRPSFRLTHAFFGATPVDEAMLLCARHLQHHRAQLP